MDPKKRFNTNIILISFRFTISLVVPCHPRVKPLDYFSYYKTFQEEHYAYKLVRQGSYDYQHFVGSSVATVPRTTVSTSLIKMRIYQVLLYE